MNSKRTLHFLFIMFIVWLMLQVRREKTDKRIKPLNDQTFAAAIARSPAVVVEFGAPWCGPCRQVQPALNRLVDTLEHRVKFYEVNIDKAPEIGKYYAGNGIPLVAVFVNGEEKEALLGAHRYENYRDMILRHVYPQPETSSP